MPAKPIVSIIGRPNVGKSSLFNRILEKRIAVVDGTPGVTRDRNYKDTEWSGTHFTIVDTGGLIPNTKENISQEINNQVAIALEESVAILFIVEANFGPTDLDLLIAQILRKSVPEKVVVAVNKTESPETDREFARFVSLGLGNPYPISAIHGRGVGDLLDAVVKLISNQKHLTATTTNTVELSIAVLGKPNAGKSSLVNMLLNDTRMIVDDKPGTTRDAIDSIMRFHHQSIRIIDTAGLRKKNRVNDPIEYYSNLRALDSIERSDVCVLLVDALEEIGEQDLKICHHVFKQRKGLLVCLNKWDLVSKDEKTFDSLSKEMKNSFSELQHIPILSISARTGQRVPLVIERALAIKERMQKQIRSKELEEIFFSWIKSQPHPFIPGKEVRFMGIKQKKGTYPFFIIFCTNPESVFPAYSRFLINKIQETYDFSGCTIILNFRPIGRSKRNPTQPGEKE